MTSFLMSLFEVNEGLTTVLMSRLEVNEEVIVVLASLILEEKVHALLIINFSVNPWLVSCRRSLPYEPNLIPCRF